MKKSISLVASESVASEATIKIDTELNLLQIRDKIQTLLDTSFPPEKSEGMTIGWNCIDDLTATYVIYNCAGDIWKVYFTINADGTVTLGAREKVVTKYVAAEAKEKKKGTLTASESIDFTSATKQDKNGWVWNIRAIREGKTLAPQQPLDELGLPGKKAYRLYSAEALQGAVDAGRFNGVPFIVRDIKEHAKIQEAQNRGYKLEEINGTERRIGGMLSKTYATASEGKLDVRGQLDLRNNQTGRDFRKYLLEREEKNLPPVGLSCTLMTKVELEDEDAEFPTLRVTDIPEVYSLDPCDEGNAQGLFLSAAEAKLNNNNKKKMKPTKLQLAVLKAWALAAAEAVEAGTDEATATSGAPASWDEYAQQYIFDNYPNAKDIWDSVDEVAKLPMEKQYKFFLTALKQTDPDNGAATGAETPEAVAAEAKKKKDLAASEGRTSNEDPRVSQLLNQLAIQSGRTILEDKLRTSTLPEVARNMVRQQFSMTAAEAGKEKAFGESVDASIRTMQDLSADLAGAPVTTRGGVKILKDERDKQAQCLNNFFFMNASEAVQKEAAKILGYNPTDNKYQAWTSYREMFLNITGQQKMGLGLFSTAAEALGVEVISQLQTDALNVAMLATYRSLIQFDDWKKITAIKTANDFRDQKVQKFGQFTVGVGVPTLPGDDYAELTLDGAEDTDYSVSRRGNLFSVTFADVVDDRVNFIQAIPGRLARMAKRDIYKQLFNLLWNGWQTNFTAYDPTAPGTPQVHPFFSSNYANYITSSASMSEDNLILARKKLMLQAEIGSSEAMGIPPKYLIHMTKDFKTARTLTTPMVGEENMTANAAQSLGLERIEVPHFPDAYERWIVAADKDDIPGMEISFLYGNQEPTIIPEAMGTGANFTADKMRWKIAHHWGASLVDPRAFVMGRAS